MTKPQRAPGKLMKFVRTAHVALFAAVVVWPSVVLAASEQTPPQNLEAGMSTSDVPLDALGFSLTAGMSYDEVARAVPKLGRLKRGPFAAAATLRGRLDSGDAEYSLVLQFFRESRSSDDRRLDSIGKVSDYKLLSTYLYLSFREAAARDKYADTQAAGLARDLGPEHCGFIPLDTMPTRIFHDDANTRSGAISKEIVSDLSKLPGNPRPLPPREMLLISRAADGMRYEPC